MNKMAEGNIASYKRAGEQWRIYRGIRGQDCGIGTAEPLRGADIVACIIHVWRKMRLTTGTIRGELHGIRYMHLVCGLGDIARVGGRAGLTLIAIAKWDRPISKILLPTEPTQWIYDNMGVDSSTETIKKVRRSIAVGVCFLFRGCATDWLRKKDVMIGGGELCELSTLPIESSKTDHEGVGVTRPLYAPNSPIFPAPNMIRWIYPINWGPERDAPIAGVNVLGKVRSTAM